MTRGIVGIVGAILLLLCLITESAAAATAGFTAGLSADEFAAAGLGKLTAAEREALDRLVANRAVATPSAASAPAVAPAPRSADSASVPEQARVRRTSSAPAPRVIHSRIEGLFTGWTGRTIFQLENGQRWIQVGGDSYQAHPPRENPEVEVQPAMMGTYFLKVDGYGTRCRVKLLDD